MKKLVLVSGLFFVMLWTSTLSVEKTKKVKRVPWTTSKITGSLESPPPYRLERVYDHLKLKNPTVLTNAPGSDRLFIAELNGRISSFPRDESKKSVDLFFDLAKHLKGAPRVYGLAFHPKFKTNRLCYLCYIVDRNLENGTRVSRFKVTRDNPPRILPETEEILLTWKSGGHNGGCLKFGPGGYRKT